jgi:hypothetical protein
MTLCTWASSLPGPTNWDGQFRLRGPTQKIGERPWRCRCRRPDRLRLAGGEADGGGDEEHYGEVGT